MNIPALISTLKGGFISLEDMELWMEWHVMTDSYRLQYNMSEILVPGLTLRESAGEENEELYSQERFVSLLEELSERSVLYYCPYDRSSLRNFFQQIAMRQGTSSLALSTVHQFISELKQRNRTELTREAAYYSDLMGGKMKQGIQSVSKRELLKAMDRYDGDLQLLTQIMRENSREAEFVGCELVLNLIRQVQEELEDAVIPELSITKLKTLRLESDRSGEEEMGVKVGPIFSEIGEYQVKRLLTHYGTQVRRKLAFYRQFIVDEEVLNDAEQFLTMLGPLEGALNEEVQQMIDANDELNARGQDFNNLIANLQVEQTLQSEIIDGLKQQGMQLREELALSDDRNSRLQEGIDELELALQTTQRELSGIAQHCQTIEQELGQERRRYDQVYAEYCKLAQESQRKSQLVREDETRRIFSSRSVKEQLEDTAQRLNRMLTERERERKEAKETEERNGNRIILLEGRLEELERELREKNEYLCEYIRESRLSGSKLSGMLRLSKITAPRPSSIHPDDQAQLLSDSLKNAPRESVNYFSMSSVNSVHRLPRSSTHPRFSRVNLSVIPPSIEEEESSIEDISEAFGEQNVVTILEEDLSDRPLPADSFKKKQSPQASPIRPVSIADSKGKYFFSRGSQVNVQGLKFQTFLLLTPKRFCYFDTKVRLERYLPITHIKEFTFLVENPNLFIIKPTNSEGLVQGKHITNDMVFSTRNVGRLQTFLAQLRKKAEVKIAVNVKPIENSWLRVNRQDYNLGMGVKNSCHPCRIALAPQPVFYADFKGEGIFPSRTKTVLIVQPMGVLCFQGEEPYELEENREFFAWLPLTDKLRIIDKRNSKEAPDRKLVIEYGKTWEKCWQIVFQTKDDTKRFKQTVEGQLELNLKLREETKQKTMKLLPSQQPQQ